MSQFRLIDMLSARASGSAAALERIAYAGLCAFLFSLPWEEAPQLNGFALSRWLGVATLGIAVLRLAVKSERRSFSVVHYLMAGFVGLSAMSIFWSADVESTLTRIGTYSQLLIAVWLIWELATAEARVLGLMQAYLLGIFVASMLTIYNFASGTTAAQLEAARGVERWEESRYSIMGVNENDLGLMLAMSMPLMIYMVVRVKSNWMRTFLWIQLVASIAAILLTGSRGALLSAAIASTMLPLSFKFLPHIAEDCRRVGVRRRGRLRDLFHSRRNLGAAAALLHRTHTRHSHSPHVDLVCRAVCISRASFSGNWIGGLRGDGLEGGECSLCRAQYFSLRVSGIRRRGSFIVAGIVGELVLRGFPDARSGEAVMGYRPSHVDGRGDGAHVGISQAYLDHVWAPGGACLLTDGSRPSRFAKFL